MTDMLEIVAKAVAGICNDKGQELASKCEMQAPTIPWQAFEREAKAAIEAYRNPTDEMLKAAHEAVRYEESLSGDWRDWAEYNTKRHQAMADAALEGKK